MPGHVPWLAKRAGGRHGKRGAVGGAQKGFNALRAIAKGNCTIDKKQIQNYSLLRPEKLNK
jgi:hypothetical protein